MSLHKLSTSQPYTGNITCKLSSGAFNILPRPVRTDICPALDCSGGFSSGGSRGEARGAPVFWVRNEKNHGRKKKTGRASKTRSGYATGLCPNKKWLPYLLCRAAWWNSLPSDLRQAKSLMGCSSPFHPHVMFLIDFIKLISPQFWKKNNLFRIKVKGKVCILV